MNDGTSGYKNDDEEFKRWVYGTVKTILALGKEREDARDFAVAIGIVVGAWIHLWPEAERDKCLERHTELVSKVMAGGGNPTESQ